MLMAKEKLSIKVAKINSVEIDNMDRTKAGEDQIL